MAVPVIAAVMQSSPAPGRDGSSGQDSGGLSPVALGCPRVGLTSPARGRLGRPERRPSGRAVMSVS